MRKKRSNSKGWVYVISDPTRPGLLKIGYTDRTPEKRAAELSGTHAPLPLVVEYQIQVEAALEAERGVHRLLDASNKRLGKEWFACTVEFAIETINTVCGPETVERKRRAQEAARQAAAKKERELADILEKQKVERQLIEAARSAELRAYDALPWYRKVASSTWSMLTTGEVANFIVWVALAIVGVVLLFLIAKVNRGAAIIIGLLALGQIPRDVMEMVIGGAIYVFVLALAVWLVWQWLS